MQYSSVYYLMLISMIMVAVRPSFLGSRSGVLIFFLALGMFTSYFDFLTYPTATLVFAITLFAFQRCSFDKMSFLLVFGAVVVWCLGFFGLWVSKWVIASMVTGQDVISDALGQAQFRTSNLWGDGIHAFTIAEMIKRLLAHFKPILICIPICCFVFVCLVDAIRKMRSRGLGFERAGWLIAEFAFIALVPVIWYVAMRNHSMIHDYMSFKTLSGTIFAVTTALATLAYKDLLDGGRVRYIPIAEGLDQRHKRSANDK